VELLLQHVCEGNVYYEMVEPLPIMLGKVPNEPIKASNMMQTKRMGKGRAIP